MDKEDVMDQKFPRNMFKASKAKRTIKPNSISFTGKAVSGVWRGMQFSIMCNDEVAMKEIWDTIYSEIGGLPLDPDGIQDIVITTQENVLDEFTEYEQKLN